MGPGRALFSWRKKGFWRQAFGPCPGACASSAQNESRTASEPCCTGTRDGAGGSGVLGLDPDAALITTAVDLLGANQDRYQKASRPQTLKSPASDEQLSDP